MATQTKVAQSILAEQRQNATDDKDKTFFRLVDAGIQFFTSRQRRRQFGVTVILPIAPNCDGQYHRDAKLSYCACSCRGLLGALQKHSSVPHITQDTQYPLQTRPRQHYVLQMGSAEWAVSLGGAVTMWYALRIYAYTHMCIDACTQICIA